MTDATETRPLPTPLDDSLTGTPARRPGSVRRTSSIDMAWPDGRHGELHLIGRARDLATTNDGDGIVVDEASMRATIGNERLVTSIESTPEHPSLQGLVGTQGGSYLRRAIDEVLPGEREAATPLHLLLDDIAGTSLIGGIAWVLQVPGPMGTGRKLEPLGVRKGRIICSGLRPGGSAHRAIADGEGPKGGTRRAGTLVVDGDELAWHEFPERTAVASRRQRRIDVTPVGDVLEVDSFFRDSTWHPDGSEWVVHEYDVVATLDAQSSELLSVQATPHVLPFPECQWAPEHASRLIGTPALEFRTTVQTTLTELQACTHLNDMLRCLAEVPALASAVRASA